MIIVIAGTKGSGKSTTAKYIAGLVLKNIGIISSFKIVESDLIVTGKVKYQNEVKEETFPMDLKIRDYEFVRYAQNKIYPHVKIFSFADLLKEFVHNMFGVSYECLYGSDEQKNTPTKILWSSLIKVVPSKLKQDYKNKNGFVTVRELLQVFGSDVCRSIYEDCHVDSCYNSILEYNSDISIIDDGRFENEILVSKKHEAKIIKLSYKPNNDNHSSETSLDNLPETAYDYIIPDCNLEEKHYHLHIALTQFGLGYLCT